MFMFWKKIIKADYIKIFKYDYKCMYVHVDTHLISKYHS